MGMLQILVFGDSIAWGAWDRKGGWAQRLKSFIDEMNIKKIEDPNFYRPVFNMGIPGNNTQNLLKRFEFETKRRIYKNEKMIFILEIGANDSLYLQSKKGNWVRPSQFRKNVQKLIGLAHKYSSKIVFIGLLPVDDSRTVPLPWDTDKSCKNKYIREYNEIVRSVCKRNDVYFVDMFHRFMKRRYQPMLIDGVHPNDEGHEMIFLAVKNFLIKKKMI
jgi:lysophospholipase L1-like esterase